MVVTGTPGGTGEHHEHNHKPNTNLREYSYSVNRSDIHILVLLTTLLLWCEFFFFFLLFPLPASLANFSHSFFRSDWVAVKLCVCFCSQHSEKRSKRGNFPGS